MSYSNINYNLYKIFVAVYECKNISRAAKELFIGQPNVSRSVKELERQLGVKLFYSNSRGVEPTNEGKELYNWISPALAWINYGERNLNEFNEGSVGLIKVVCATSFAGHILAKYINMFNKKFPLVKFDIAYRNIEQAAELLSKCSVDLVFSFSRLDLEKNFEIMPLIQLRRTYFASESFKEKYGLEKKITKDKLSKLPLIAYRTLEKVENPIAIVETQEMCFQLVSNNIGAGFCTEKFLDYIHQNDKVFRFEVENAELPNVILNCIFLKGFVSRAVKAFIDELVASALGE